MRLRADSSSERAWGPWGPRGRLALCLTVALLCGCKTPPKHTSESSEDTLRELESLLTDRQRTDTQDEEKRRRRRQKLLDTVSDGRNLFGDLLRKDPYDGALLAGFAIEAYAEGKDLKAVLFAQAALGADPGNNSRRNLLKAIEGLTGIDADREGILPLNSLIHLELKRANQAFFSERFGEAVQACRRALSLDPENAEGWSRLGSAHYAMGEKNPARAAFHRALESDPYDEELQRILEEKDWSIPRPGPASEDEQDESPPRPGPASEDEQDWAQQ